MSAQDKLSEKWPWNGEFLRLFLLAPAVVGITATVATYPFAGVQSLWFLTAILAGVVLYLTYGAAGRRVEALRRELRSEAELAEGLLVIGKVHSPGVVVLRKDELELIPIAGERRKVAFDEIESIGEGRWLPGKFVWGKRAFTISAAVLNPLAFAVPESVGARWSGMIRARIGDEA